MTNTVLIITAILANVAATIGVGIAMVNEIRKTSEWRGWADTKIRDHEVRLNSHSGRIGRVENDFARHEGASGGQLSGGN